MRQFKLLLTFSITLILIHIQVVSTIAGVTGKIRGTVKDLKTGNALPGVNVIISSVWVQGVEKEFDADIGAASDFNGEFIILKVPPGIYSVSASMIGYNLSVNTHVKVSVDRTTTVDFKLEETVLDIGGEVVVEAKRDLVQIDVAATENYITSQDYQATPFANRIEDVLALQSGVTGNIIEGDIKIREGETREVGFLLDGMDMVDRKFNRPVISVQPAVVQEMKLMRNGFNAEYGQARSGVINVITKNPADRLHFSLDYQFDPANKPHYGRNKYDPNYNLWRLYAGPNAFEGDSLVTPDGIHENIRTWEGWNSYAEKLLNDNNPDNDLTAEEAYELWKWRHRPLKYGDKVGHNIDMALSGRVPLIPWRSNFLLGGRYERHPFAYPTSRDYYDERISSLKMVNMLSPDLKLTLNGMYSEVYSVTEGSATSEWSEEDRIEYSNAGFPSYYPFSRPVIDRYTTIAGAKLLHTLSPRLFYEVSLNHFYVKWRTGQPKFAKAEDGRYFHGRLYYDPQSGRIPREKGADDTVSGYTMYGGAINWDHSWNRRTSLEATLTDQFHPAHELKAGFKVNYDILLQDRIHWDHEDSTQEYRREFRVEPYEIGAFVQDKIEFQGMIANVGVRIDYFNTNSTRPDLHRALEFEKNEDIWKAFLAGEYPTTGPKSKFYVSPRVGISHPLSERSKIYFNYGHFVQTPPTQGLYLTVTDGALPRMQWIGDPNLPFEKTIAYELGFDMDLNDFFTLHIGAFYKDYYDVTSGMVYAHSDQSLVLEWPAYNEYSEIRGVELEIKKSVGRFITGWLNYNYIKKSVSDLEIPNLSDIPIITDDPNIGRNGVLWGVPRSIIPQLQPYARGVITLSAPPNWGPRLANYSVLQNTDLSFQVYYQSGAYKEHPRSSFRDAHPDVRFKELAKYWTNMRLSRRMRMKGVDFQLYMDVSSVLHTTFRNPPGGRSGEDYYDDLWASGRLDKVGTDELTNPKILRTESDDVYWAKVKTFIFGLRINL